MQIAITLTVLAYIQDSYHTDSSAGGDTVARQLESMEDKLDTILISLQPSCRGWIRLTM